MHREIREPYQAAAAAFEQCRGLNPENVYAYITQVQLVVEVARHLRTGVGAKTLAGVGNEHREIRTWIQSEMALAEELLAKAKQLYRPLEDTDGSDSYFTNCYAGLKDVYGDLDQVIRLLMHSRETDERACLHVQQRWRPLILREGVVNGMV